MASISVNYPPQDARFVLDNNEGWVALLRYSGEEVDIVNSARVSFRQNAFLDG